MNPAAHAGADGGRSGNPVVVRLMDGKEIQGTVQNFNARTPVFVMHTEGGPRRVAFDCVKTVAFARPGPESSQRSGGFSSNARLVTVRFRDDSTLQGVAENFGGPRAGVFVVPTACAEVERVYIPVSAVRDVESVQRLGDILTEKKVVTLEMVQAALRRQRELREEASGEILLSEQASDRAARAPFRALERDPDGGRIGEILVEQEFLSRDELKGALELQRAQPGRKLGELLIGLGHASPKMIAIALSIQYNLPFLSLEYHRVEPSLRDLLRREEALEWQLLPLGLEGDVLTVAIADPEAGEFAPVLERRSGATVSPVISTLQDVRRLIRILYPQSA